MTTYSTPGREQFARMIPEFRNTSLHIVMAALLDMRSDVLANDEFSARGGTDDSTRSHILAHLKRCDDFRRHITYNPDRRNIGLEIAHALDPNGSAMSGQDRNTDLVQSQSTPISPLPWRFDGSDPDIPLRSQLRINNNGALILIARIDEALVAITRLETRNASHNITVQDSLRIYQIFRRLYEATIRFMGNANRVDIVQVLPSQEPLGPESSPNRTGEQESAQQSGSLEQSTSSVSPLFAPLDPPPLGRA